MTKLSLSLIVTYFRVVQSGHGGVGVYVRSHYGVQEIDRCHGDRDVLHVFRFRRQTTPPAF